MFVNDQGKNFDPDPQGTYAACCVGLVDLGIQETEYKGNKKKQHKVWLGFEIPALKKQTFEQQNGEKIEINAQRGITFTASLDKKANLRKMLESWRDRAFTKEELAGFNLSTILGVNCMVSMRHNEDGTSSYIANIMPCPKELKFKPNRVPYEYSMDFKNDSNVMKSINHFSAYMPKSLIEKIKKSDTYIYLQTLQQKEEIVNPGMAPDDFVDMDEVPF